jgi:hypothetical protein
VLAACKVLACTPNRHMKHFNILPYQQINTTKICQSPTKQLQPCITIMTRHTDDSYCPTYEEWSSYGNNPRDFVTASYSSTNRSLTTAMKSGDVMEKMEKMEKIAGCPTKNKKYPVSSVVSEVCNEPVPEESSVIIRSMHITWL